MSISPTALVAGLALSVSLELAGLLFAVTPAGVRWSGVVDLFYRAASDFIGGYLGRTPYLSFYPPLSLVAITPPRLIARDIGTFAFLLGLEMSIVAGMGLVLVIRPRWRSVYGEMETAAPTYAAFVLLGAFVLPSTFDILPGVLTLGAVAAAVQSRGWAAGAMLGLAFGLKLYAVVLLPAILLWYLSEGHRRQAAMAFAGFMIAASVGFALYIAFSPASPADLVRSLADRGLQIESLGGSLISFAAAFGVVPPPGVVYAGSFEVVGGAASAAVRVLTFGAPLMVLGVLVATAWGLRRRDTDSIEGLVLALTASLLAVLVSSKVFSPQYMLWLVPVVPFLSGPKRILLLVAMALTAVVFPFVYDGVLNLELIPTALLLLRNLLLVALLSWVVAELLGIRIPSREDLSIRSDARLPSEIGR